MRALAEFIMRGRLQASLVALVGNLVPLISPATVALVTLRRNYVDGLLVLLWAAIPLLATLYWGSASYLIVFTSLTTLLAVLVAGEVLRGTASWQITLLVVLAVCGLSVLVAGGLMAQETQRVVGESQAVLNNLEALQDNPASPFFVLMAITAAGLSVETITAGFAFGFLAWLTAFHVIASVLLARWWQALLFNPGGFQKEFHQLRLSVAVALMLMVAVIVLQFLSPGLMPWASMMGLPLLLAGVALTHHTVSSLGLGTVWLVLFYVGLILIGPLSMVLIGVGFLDSFFDFRTRIARMRKS